METNKLEQHILLNLKLVLKYAKVTGTDTNSFATGIGHSVTFSGTSVTLCNFITENC